MKRLNDRVEKRIQDLGLDKNSKESYDIAMESLDAEDCYDHVDDDSVLRNPQTGGLWLGGMDRNRTRDFWKEDLSFHDDRDAIQISSDSDSDDNDVDTQLRLGGGYRMEVGEGSSSRQQADTQAAADPMMVDVVDVVQPNPEPDDRDVVGESSDSDYEFLLRHPQPAVSDEFLVRYFEREKAARIAANRRIARSEPEHPAENSGTPEPVNEVEQLGSAGGDFWEALKRVRERTSKIEAEELIEWTPSNISGAASVYVPSLVELSLNVLTENENCIASQLSTLPSPPGPPLSLYPVPYFLRKKLIDRLCDKRKMDATTLKLLVQGCPTELRVKNCAWLTDDQFHQLLQSWKTENLRVLQLDLAGQIMFDFAFRDKLGKSQNSFSMLAVLSLRGSCRLTDPGVELLVKSAPELVSVNLGLCSLVTSKSVKSIADYLGEHLRELYIDGCENIKAMQIASDIMKFKKLEVFSVANLEDVSDVFIELLVSVCGESLKDLDVADCLKLTDSSLKAVASHCPGLLGLNISSLLKVTNVGMEFLANGCRSIQRLNLKKTKFSDEVIAAFIEISGGSLTELTLNYVSQVGPNTALSLARRSRYLSYLDISWCRRISTNAICLIADSCLSLKLLKIFNCKQISAMILNGHSNTQLRVIGHGLAPILDHLNVLEPDHEVYLRYSPLPTPIDS